MTDPSGNREFCFPLTSMFIAMGTLRVLGKQNSLFPEGPVIKNLTFFYYVNILMMAFLPKISYHFLKISEDFQKLLRRPDKRS